jgi:hypothetical protein
MVSVPATPVSPVSSVTSGPAPMIVWVMDIVSMVLATAVLVGLVMIAHRRCVPMAARVRVSASMPLVCVSQATLGLIVRS